MTEREVLKLALDALDLLAKYENPSTKIQVRKPRDGGPIVTMYPHKVATDAAALLRERLAQPEQEPVAWVNQANLNSAAIQRDRGGQGDTHTWSETPNAYHPIPLYTTPPQRKPLSLAELFLNTPQRKPLSDEEIYKIANDLFYGNGPCDTLAMCRAIEAAHGIKE